MGISVRLLREWRREALEAKAIADEHGGRDHWSERILRLTQELMDRELLEGSRRRKEGS